MMLIKCLSFLLAITSVSALGKLWKVNNFKTNEKTMKKILQSCYGKDNPIKRIFIYGDFDEATDELPVIRAKDSMFRNNLPYWEKHNLFEHPLTVGSVDVMVFIGNSPAEMASFIATITETYFFDYMAPFYIFGREIETCKNAADFLRTAWRFNILNAVYICSESTSTSTLYILNPISDYAPDPWKRLERADDLYVFHQVFDPDISCQHLDYDKTKFLNGYQIKAISENKYSRPGRDYFELLSGEKWIGYRAVRMIVEALNASCRLETEKTRKATFDRCLEETSDLLMDSFTLSTVLELSSFFPHSRGIMVAVVKLNREVSTQEKILHLWSPTVLIMAAIVITILFLILTIKNHSPSFAMLDLTRLLIYTSIATNDRTHSFRIYFTTMLIFMVISNGVFQGKIAEFLTTRERIPPITTIDELVKLKYKMYVPYGTKPFAERGCSKCHFIETSMGECVQLALDGNLQTCIISQNYWSKTLSTSSNHVKEILHEELQSFKCRRNWPLYNRFNNMLMRLVESGILDHLEEQSIYAARRKREALEAEWSSTEYRDVKLVKLEFAFQLLAIGLSLATIVFILELIVSKLSAFLSTR